MQDPDNLQNFNRYSYCFNNPLKYTDPSGYTAHYTGSAINYVTPESYLGNFTLDNNYGVYVDGDKVYGGEGDFWLSLSTGITSVFNYGFTGTAMSHLMYISAQFLNGMMHTDNENANFNYDKQTIAQRQQTWEEKNSPPPGWNNPGSTPLPEVEITKNSDGTFSKPSYDLWNYINNERYSGFNMATHAELLSDDWIGPALIAIGARIKALKPGAILGSKPGSSIASTVLSKILPIKMPFRIAGTNNLGRILGRTLPFTAFGVVMTAFSIEDAFREISPTFDKIIGMRDFKMGIYNPNDSKKK